MIRRALVETDKVSKERAPQVGIEDFADSCITLGIRFWAPTSHYFETRYRANAAIFAVLRAADITIPFPILTLDINRADLEYLKSTPPPVKK